MRTQSIAMRNERTAHRNLLFGLSLVLDDEDLIRLRYRVEQAQKDNIALSETLEWLNEQLLWRFTHSDERNPWFKLLYEHQKTQEIE